MKKTKTDQPIHAGIGTVSVILIFTVLCLTAFGVLSLISARNSALVTENNIEYVCSFYGASAKANEYIAECAEAGKPGEYSASYDIGNGLSLYADFRIGENGSVHIRQFLTVAEGSSSFAEFE